MKLMVVEDSAPLAEALSGHLRGLGHACDVAADGPSALALLEVVRYDVVVLDLMLPGLDGFALLERHRARLQGTPVLVLSARDQVGDRVRALDAGADDYLVKPFALEELLARTRALVRRPAQRLAPVLERGRVSLDTRSRVARCGGRDLQLSPKEFALLELLMRQPGRVYSRAQIFDHLYESDSTASDKVVEVIVSVLRGKLVRGGADELIRTRRGFGYVLE